jgi:hypothetical protein
VSQFSIASVSGELIAIPASGECRERMTDNSDSMDRSQTLEDDAERYRAAAEATLDQLDWCIAYLHRIRKSPIATALARNQSQIRRQLP